MPYCEGGGMLSINGNNIFTRHIIVDSDHVNNIRKRFNNKDCYISAFQYETQDQESSNIIGPIYLDLDHELNNDEDLKIIQYDLVQCVSFFRFQCGIPKEFISVYYSGCKGFHIIVPAEIFDIKPEHDLNLKYKMIAAHIRDNTTNYKTIDTRIYDRVRLFRMSNSINSKTGLYKVWIPYDFASKCNYQELREYASRPKLISGKSITPYVIPQAVNKFNEICNVNSSFVSRRVICNKNFEMSDCIKQMLTSEAPEGTRNNTCIVLASSLLQCGRTEEEILQTLLDWNITYNTVKLSKREITAVVKSAVKEHESGKAYGCSSIKDLGYCIGAACKYFKSK